MLLSHAAGRSTVIQPYRDYRNPVGQRKRKKKRGETGRTATRGGPGSRGGMGMLHKGSHGAMGRPYGRSYGGVSASPLATMMQLEMQKQRWDKEDRRADEIHEANMAAVDRRVQGDKNKASLQSDSMLAGALGALGVQPPYIAAFQIATSPAEWAVNLRKLGDQGYDKAAEILGSEKAREIYDNIANRVYGPPDANKGFNGNSSSTQSESTTGGPSSTPPTSKPTAAPFVQNVADTVLNAAAAEAQNAGAPPLVNHTPSDWQAAINEQVRLDAIKQRELNREAGAAAKANDWYAKKPEKTPTSQPTELPTFEKLLRFADKYVEPLLNQSSARQHVAGVSNGTVTTNHAPIAHAHTSNGTHNITVNASDKTVGVHTVNKEGTHTHETFAEYLNYTNNRTYQPNAAGALRFAADNRSNFSATNTSRSASSMGQGRALDQSNATSMAQDLANSSKYAASVKYEGMQNSTDPSWGRKSRRRVLPPSTPSPLKIAQFERDVVKPPVTQSTGDRAVTNQIYTYEEPVDNAGMQNNDNPSSGRVPTGTPTEAPFIRRQVDRMVNTISENIDQKVQDQRGY